VKALLVLALGAGVANADVKVEELAAQPALTKTIKAKPAQLAAAMQKAILGLVAEADVVTGPPFARYLSRGATFVVEVGVPVRKGRAALPAGPAAVVEFRGPHAKLAAAHAELDVWLAANKRTAAGARWEVYVTNPITTPDANAQTTRVYAPLAK
jgi:AraC family transcriptional regulator